MFQKANRQFKQRGQGMVEYIIIVALIAIAGIAVFGLFGQTIKAQVGGMAQELSGNSGAASVATAKTAADNAVTKGTTTTNMKSYTGQN